MNDEIVIPKELQEKMYPGFFIKCAKCGSLCVRVENTLYFTESAGGMGCVSLICLDCKNEVDLAELE